MTSCKLSSSLHKLPIVTTNEQLVLNDLNAKAEIKKKPKLTTKEEAACVTEPTFAIESLIKQLMYWIHEVFRDNMGWIVFIVGGFKAIQLIYTIQHNNNKIRKKTVYKIERVEIAQSTMFYEMKKTFENCAKVVKTWYSQKLLSESDTRLN